MIPEDLLSPKDPYESIGYRKHRWWAVPTLQMSPTVKIPALVFKDRDRENFWRF
jgi:hypothetical protein